MTKASDLVDALELRQPGGAVPIWELEYHLWEKASERRLIQGTELTGISSSELEKALHDNAEIFLSVSKEMCFAAISVPNEFWEIRPGHLAYYCYPEEARFRQIEILSKMKPPDVMLAALCNGVLGIPFGDDFVPFSYSLYDAPKEVDQMAKERLEGALENSKRLIDCGVEIIVTPSDIADNHGAFMKSEHMDRFVFPYLTRWAEEIKALGAYAILHSDGNLMTCLDRISESGIHALQAIDPTAGMDMLTVKRVIGDKVCLCGNIDCHILLSGSQQDVYKATVRLLQDCKSGGGFSLGASNAVQQQVPLKNYHAMIQAWCDHGQYSNEA